MSKWTYNNNILCSTVIGNTTAYTQCHMHEDRIWRCYLTVSWERQVESLEDKDIPGLGMAYASTAQDSTGNSPIHMGKQSGVATVPINY